LDYSQLQRQADAERGLPAAFDGIAYDSAAERDFARRKYRALHGMEAASDQKVDHYIAMQEMCDSERKNT
jgi:hypothetical protein